MIKKRMQDALDDMMRSRCDLGEEHAYHRDQMKRYMENQIYGNSEEMKYVLSLHKLHVISYPENDLEELKSRWISYIKGKLVTRPNPDDVYSDQKIVEVIRTQYDQGHGQEFMKEIIARRDDGEMSSFLESNYKYLNKNDIEYFNVIWERVHNYQLGYQIKVNLTAPKLTFPAIEEKTPYSITTLPFVGLIYENSKKEKRIMEIDEISKFCDATL
ncbi:hypothetical protein Tco_0704704 [Tanacetum coccineum]|uniref:Uncharacterized protein n=1 Tax=Tanacetum coccineum TaxID=301880 RepID=A0ABQ4Y2I2_9ASTR